MKTRFTKMVILFMALSFTMNAQSRIRNGAHNRNALKFATMRHASGNALTASRHSSGANLANSISGYYVEDFEGTFPPAGWQIVDITDPTNSWSQAVGIGYNSNNSAFINFSDAAVAGEDWLITPKFTAASTDSISFRMMVEYIGFPPDQTDILVSTTDSSIASFTSVVGTLSEGVDYPDNTAFAYYSFSLAAYAGQDIYIAFKNTNLDGDGVYIDHVVLGTPPAINAGVASIDLSSGVPTASIIPIATIVNEGIAPQSFPVTMTITGGYTSTKNVTALGAGIAQQVSFDPWTPTLGAQTITVESQLPSDGYAQNDTLSKTVTGYHPFLNYGWSAKAPLLTGTFDGACASAIVGDSSHLFSFGGVDAAFAISDAVSEFTPYANTWAAGAALPNPNFVSQAVTVGNKIYLAGGYNPSFTALDFNQIYDPVADSWSAGATMPTPVGDYAVGVYQGLIYYFGGFNGTADIGDVQIYHPSTDTWSTATSLPGEAAGWRGGISGNKIVITGGFNQAAGAEVASTYIGTIDASDPGQITWTTGPDYPGGTAGRMCGGALLSPASNLIVFTGGDPDGSGDNAIDGTFGYDVSIGEWEVGPSKPTPVNNLCNFATVVSNDSIYMAALGGLAGGATVDVNEWLNMGKAPAVGISKNDLSEFNIRSYPNPFVSSTQIAFTLVKNTNVKAEITDVLGNTIEEICNQSMSAGNHQLIWNASKYSNGIYFCKISVNGSSVTKKLLKY